MKSINACIDELESCFSCWNKIMEMWNDKKSHTINDSTFHTLYECGHQIVDLADQLLIEIKRIEYEYETI